MAEDIYQGLLAEAIRGQRPATLQELKRSVSSIGLAIASLNVVVSALVEADGDAAKEALIEVGIALQDLQTLLEGLRRG